MTSKIIVEKIDDDLIQMHKRWSCLENLGAFNLQEVLFKSSGASPDIENGVDNLIEFVDCLYEKIGNFWQTVYERYPEVSDTGSYYLRLSTWSIIEK